jgi:hypothetical protein
MKGSKNSKHSSHLNLLTAEPSVINPWHIMLCQSAKNFQHRLPFQVFLSGLCGYWWEWWFPDIYFWQKPHFITTLNCTENSTSLSVVLVTSSLVLMHFCSVTASGFFIQCVGDCDYYISSRVSVTIDGVQIGNLFTIYTINSYLQAI